MYCFYNLINAGGQKRTLFQLSAVHKNTLTLVMDIKEENKDTIGKALAVGYRAGRIVGTAHRRASEETAPAVLNELSRARTSLEEAIFCLEEVKGVEGSIDGSISASQEFVMEYSKAIDTCVLDRYAVGTLRCGMDEAAEAVECLKGLVDGYRSLDGDKH